MSTGESVRRLSSRAAAGAPLSGDDRAAVFRTCAPKRTESRRSSVPGSSRGRRAAATRRRANLVADDPVYGASGPDADGDRTPEPGIRYRLSAEADPSHPLLRRAGIPLYAVVQGFTGHGEDLRDDDREQSRLRLGLGIAR
jgi:hypothetical protein